MMYTQMDIDLDVIAENYKKVSDRLPGETRIIVVVKADAYGLGAVPITKRLEKAGCPMFVATLVEEIAKLREAGIKAPVLVMTSAENKELLIAGKHRPIITVTDYEMTKQISDELVKRSYSLPAHLEVGCELSRMGIVLKDRLEEAAEEAARIHTLPDLNTEVAFSHLTAVGTEGAHAALDLTEQQRFSELIKMLKRKGIPIKTHLMNSDPYV